MKVELGEVKGVLMDLVMFDDGLDANGKRLFRKTFPRTVYSGCVGAKSRLIANMLFGVIENDNVTWYKHGEIPEGSRATAEKWSDEPVEFTNKEISALKQLYLERNDIAIVSQESLEALEALFK